MIMCTSLCGCKIISAWKTIVSKKSENCWRQVLKQSVGPIPITTYRLEDLVTAPFTHAGFCAFVDCRSLSCLFLFGLSFPFLASSFLLPSLCLCVCVCSLCGDDGDGDDDEKNSTSQKPKQSRSLISYKFQSQLYDSPCLSQGES